MEAGTVLDWKADARLLRLQGVSEREIASRVGKSPSSVHEAVKDVEVRHDLEANGLNAHAPQYDTDRLARLAGGQLVPGQQTIDGREVTEADVAAATQPPPEEIVLRGSTPLDFFNAGGKLPNKATIKFVGGKVGLEQGTAFKKGDVVQFEGYATVVAATPRDKRDKQTGVVLECELQLQAEIDDLRLVHDVG
jgi:hypothetical protein